MKPHGALYNAMVDDTEKADATAAAVAEFDMSLVALGLPGSAWLRSAEAAGLVTATEGFPDRAYTPAGALVPRTGSGSFVTDDGEIARRATAMATGKPVADVNGAPLRLSPDSVCIHGDSPDAGRTALAVCRTLRDAGVELAAFAAP